MTLTMEISIHALREEGDGRTMLMEVGPDISIHALREEGDMPSRSISLNDYIFLSTPSARRATSSGVNESSVM